MLRHIKNFLKSQLRKRGYHLLWVNPIDLTGFDLEEDLRRIIPNRKPVVFDVGANEGQTIELMQRTLIEPRILAFEPSERMFAKLESQDFGGEVRLFKVGLGAKPGEVTFNEYESSVLNSVFEIDRQENNPFRHVKKVNTTTVSIETIDQVMTKEEIRKVDLLKIDTQGFDLEVLRGASQAIANGRIRYVLVEINFLSLYQGQAAASDVQNFLSERSFKLVDLYEKHRHDGFISWCTALYKHHL